MNIFFIICGIVFFIISFLILFKAKSIDTSKKQQIKEKERLQEQIGYLSAEKEKLNKDLVVINDLKHEEDLKLKSLKTFTEDQEKIADKLYKDNLKLQQTNKQTEQRYLILLSKTTDMQQKVDNYYQQQKQKVDKRLEEFKNISSKAAEQYFSNLQEAYKHADAAHAQKMTRLKEEQDSAAADLNNLKETRKAAYEAILRQNEVKKNKDDYRLKPSEVDLYDIRSLKHLSKTFHKPRVISMLIWQYYFQPLAKKQFPIILKGSTKMGIYKITNLLTDQSYIGQSVDVYKRWTDHCKAGLGIDTPVGNRLYQKMGSDGLQNFTFELLCECSKEELDEKERYFIDLYQSNLFGYNITKGNK